MLHSTTSNSTSEVGTGAGWKEVRSGGIVSLNDGGGSGRASANGGNVVGEYEVEFFR